MTIAARWLWPILVLALLVACAQPDGAGPAAARATITATALPSLAPTATAVPAAAPTATVAPAVATPAATPGGAWIALSPSGGPPGTTVLMRGHVPGGPSAASAARDEGKRHGTVCWAGCVEGLTIETGGIVWSTDTSGDFTLRFTVPAQPWLAASGPHALTAGDYAVGIQCVGVVVKGCLGQPAQASATFHLRGAAPGRCLPDGPCAQLRFIPAAAAPGASVTVQGWAPLTAIIGSQPFGYTLVLSGPAVPQPAQLDGQIRQAPDGTLAGSFRLPLALPGQAPLAPGTYTIAMTALHPVAPRRESTPVAGATVTPIGKGLGAVERITLAPTPFTITAAPAWADLGAITPVWVQHGGFNQPIGSDPQDPRRVAYCAPDGIHATADGGVTWTAISTAGAAQAAAGSAYPLMHSASQSSGGPPICAAVTLDPDHPASFYATFAAYRQAAPPIYYVGYSTADDGRTWQAVPVPGGGDQGQFGGFQVVGRAVEALGAAPVRFSGVPTGDSPAPATPAAAEQTDDGGHTWHALLLDCPGAGPCLRLGPLPSGIGSCAMHGYLQPILASADRGRTWSGVTWPEGSNACGASEIVSLSATKAVLLAGNSPYPLLVSPDAGQTWEAVALPSPAGAADAYQPFTIVMLPTGALLAEAAGEASWQLLVVGGTAWCSLAGPTLPPALGTVAVIGDRLWWLAGSGPAARGVTPTSVAVRSLRCGQGGR